jgi:hypothetical protein
MDRNGTCIAEDYCSSYNLIIGRLPLAVFSLGTFTSAS